MKKIAIALITTAIFGFSAQAFSQTTPVEEVNTTNGREAAKEHMREKVKNMSPEERQKFKEERKDIKEKRKELYKSATPEQKAKMNEIRKERKAMRMEHRKGSNSTLPTN